jgi:hypothetical protein
MTKVGTKSSVNQEVLPSDTHRRLIEMWLHGLSPQTQDRYRRTSRRFLDFVNKPLHLVTLADLQGWHLTLLDLSPSSQRTALATFTALAMNLARIVSWLKESHYRNFGYHGLRHWHLRETHIAHSPTATTAMQRRFSTFFWQYHHASGCRSSIWKGADGD